MASPLRMQHCVVDQVLGWRLEDRWHPVVSFCRCCPFGGAWGPLSPAGSPQPRRPLSSPTQVRIGGIDPQNNAMLDYEERQVIATYVHPGFTFGSVFELKPWMNNDVALMLLDKPSSKRRPRLPQYKGTGRARGAGVPGRRAPQPQYPAVAPAPELIPGLFSPAAPSRRGVQPSRRPSLPPTRPCGAWATAA